MSILNQESFTKALNSTFSIEFPDQTIDLKLVECLDQTSEAMPDFIRFSLLFETQGPFFEQAMYPLEHSELGTNELLLVPVHGDDKGFQYEAIVNYKK